jgi:hypothetical protein
MKTTATTQNNNGNRREFADYERVIVTGEWGHSAGRPVTQEVATVHAYDSETGKYWVIFRSGHGNGNSWHEADKLAHVPDWIKDGAQVYSATGWRAGQPFTISNAAAEVVTLTAADGFKFRADIVEVLTEFSRTA